MYKLPERRGGGGGEVIWAMPEINRFFLCDVLPKGGSNFPLQKYYNTKSKYVSFFLNQDFLNIQGGGSSLWSA